MGVKIDDKGHIMIEGARASFPHLFEKAVFGGEETKYEVTLVVSDQQDVATLKKLIEQKIGQYNQGQKKAKIFDVGKWCLRPSDRDEYPDDAWILKVSSKEKPLVLKKGQRERAVDNEEAGIYSGCLVKTKISIWLQDNDFGRRVNGSLLAIQFAGDAESFDSSYISPESAMEGFDGSATSDDF